ncbi:MAG: hypothetical protein GY936_06720 [Ignavibacteriae bacterium]|nr:hypothetical protein [Ignavibacteriota bacterium]
MKNRILLFLVPLLLGLTNLYAQPTELSADNGLIKVMLDLTRGGAIKYLSNSGTSRNLVNIHDEGRYIQQSYYAGNTLIEQKMGKLHIGLRGLGILFRLEMHFGTVLKYLITNKMVILFMLSVFQCYGI